MVSGCNKTRKYVIQVFDSCSFRHNEKSRLVGSLIIMVKMILARNIA